jgi:hypothetical protein
VNGDSLISAAGDLGPRFRFVSMLPVAVLALYALALYWSGAPGRAPDVAQVIAHARHAAGWAGFLLALGILVTALIAEPLQVSLIRLLEGYWGESPGARSIAAPGKAFQRWRRDQLDRNQRRTGGSAASPARQAAREEAARKLRSYPPRAAILPTRLGNVLRSAEHRAGSRYGLEATTAWPRLYPLLSDKLTAVLDDLRDQLDLAVRFCAVFGLATVLSACCLATHGWWLAVAAGTLLVAVLCYRAALSAAAAYGEAVEAAFDLHRFDLLKALHLPLPANLVEERAANERLSAFLAQPAEYVLALSAGRAGVENFVYQHEPTGHDGTPAALAKTSGPVSWLRNLLSRRLGRLPRRLGRRRRGTGTPALPRTRPTGAGSALPSRPRARRA